MLLEARARVCAYEHACLDACVKSLVRECWTIDSITDSKILRIIVLRFLTVVPFELINDICRRWVYTCAE